MPGISEISSHDGRGQYTEILQNFGKSEKERRFQPKRFIKTRGFPMHESLNPSKRGGNSLPLLASFKNKARDPVAARSDGFC